MEFPAVLGVFLIKGRGATVSMILVVHVTRVKAPFRWTFAVGNLDDNKRIWAKKFTSQFCKPRQSKILENHEYYISGSELHVDKTLHWLSRLCVHITPPRCAQYPPM